MFSIYFNPRLAKWQVRLLKFGFLWIPIKNAEFDKLIEARNWVQQKGLDRHYDEMTYKGKYLNFPHFAQGVK
jgi:hypothetical protein